MAEALGNAVMKAVLYDLVKTTVEIPSDFTSKMIPAGARGTIVECYEMPEGYAVDIAIPNDKLVGDFEHEHVLLLPAQFEVVQSQKH